MQRMRSGPAPAGTDASPVEQPSTTCQKHQTSAYCTCTHKPRQSRTPVHFPVRTSNAAAWALVTLVVGAFLIAACVLLTLGAPS